MCHLGIFSPWGQRHVLHNGRPARLLTLHRRLGIDGGSGHRLLLRVRILAEGAEDGDLLALAAGRHWLGFGLQQVQGLAILLCIVLNMRLEP